MLAYLILSATMNNATTLYVDPPTTKRAVGQYFNINITISRVADLFGCQFQLSWNQAILNATNVTEGPFLEWGGNSPYFYQKINETGLLSFCTRSGNVTGVSGSGVLETIQFHVTGTGECDLHLYGTILVNLLLNGSERSIGHIVESGEFST